jgi:hypothetical protein
VRVDSWLIAGASLLLGAAASVAPVPSTAVMLAVGWFLTRRRLALFALSVALFGGSTTWAGSSAGPGPP